MKSKDITQKMLERYNDVFADIVNVLLFSYCTRVVYFYCEKCRKLFSDLIMSDSVSRVFVGNSANRIFYIRVINRLYLYSSFKK